MDVAPTDTIVSLMDALSMNAGVPGENLAFHFYGRKLHPTMTVETSGLRDGDTILYTWSDNPAQEMAEDLELVQKALYNSILSALRENLDVIEMVVESDEELCAQIEGDPTVRRLLDDPASFVDDLEMAMNTDEASLLNIDRLLDHVEQMPGGLRMIKRQLDKSLNDRGETQGIPLRIGKGQEAPSEQPLPDFEQEVEEESSGLMEGSHKIIEGLLQCAESGVDFIAMAHGMTQEGGTEERGVIVGDSMEENYTPQIRELHSYGYLDDEEIKQKLQEAKGNLAVAMKLLEEGDV